MSGKLFIVGEYQVLEKKGIAIVKAINKFLNLRIEDNDFYGVKTSKETVTFKYEEEFITFTNTDNLLLKAAINVAFKYLKYKKIVVSPFMIFIGSELENENGEKYGFGSSAALISGIIKIILSKFLVDKITNDLIFKLSVLAQYESNNNTSGADLATAISKKMVFYQRYNKKYISKKYTDVKIVEKKWPDLKILPIDTKLNFGAVWTKSSYKTTNIESFLAKRDLKIAKIIVNKAYVAIKNNKYHEAKNQINNYQKWLTKILMARDENLVTKEIETANSILSKFYLGNKISGAGGGDSLIFLYPDNFYFDELKKELEINNLELINI